MSSQYTPLDKPLRVLCLDHEGGHGGSSRSLYAVLRHVDSSQVSVEVWGRQDYGIKSKYQDLKIEFKVVPGMPVYSVFSTSPVRNLSVLKSKMKDFINFRKDAAQFADEVKSRFDVIHFNHVSFFLLAWYLKFKTGLPSVMHIRTRPYDSLMAYVQAKIIKRIVSHHVFITENERKYLYDLIGPVKGKIVHNLSITNTNEVSPHPAVAADNRLKISSLSNYDYVRGVDLIIELAKVIDQGGRRDDILFVMAGDMNLTKGLPGRLGEIGAAGGSLADYVNELGLSDMFLFLGHVENPEAVLVACDITIKLSRDNNPWGRDIIEALSFGRPVIAMGSWQGFIHDEQTGYLFDVFDSNVIRQKILDLADNREQLRTMSVECRRSIEEICDGPTSARKLIEIWRESALTRPSNANS